MNWKVFRTRKPVSSTVPEFTLKDWARPREISAEQDLNCTALPLH